MATAGDLCKAALQEIGVLAAGETMDAAMQTDTLARLNRWLDSLAASNLFIYTVTRTTATLTANQASFTVGSSGNINITRPVFIEKVNFIDTAFDPDQEYEMPELLTEEQYAAIPVKALTSVYPECAYYNPTFPTGTLIPWPIPTSATLLWAIYHWAAVSEFALPSTAVSLPPGYSEAITQNLAVLLCPSYEKSPHPVLLKSAAEGLAMVKRANHRRRTLRFPADVLGERQWWGSYNIYTDQGA